MAKFMYRMLWDKIGKSAGAIETPVKATSYEKRHNALANFHTNRIRHSLVIFGFLKEERAYDKSLVILKQFFFT